MRKWCLTTAVSEPLLSTLCILAEGLKKAFGKVRALDGVDVSVQAGTIMAMLGPNGAGKTTFMRILASLMRPDAGRAEVAGHDVLREPEVVRSLIGLTGQYAAVDENLTGRENLEMVGLAHAVHANVVLE